jgi:hypothetical protein
MKTAYIVALIPILATQMLISSDSNVELQGIQVGALRKNVEKALSDAKILGFKSGFGDGYCEAYRLPGNWLLTIWFDHSGSVQGERTVNDENRVLNIILSPPTPPEK